MSHSIIGICTYSLFPNRLGGLEKVFLIDKRGPGAWNFLKIMFDYFENENKTEIISTQCTN